MLYICMKRQLVENEDTRVFVAFLLSSYQIEIAGELRIMFLRRPTLLHYMDRVPLKNDNDMHISLSFR